MWGVPQISGAVGARWGTLPRCNAGGVGGTKRTIKHEVTFGIHTFGDLGE